MSSPQLPNAADYLALGRALRELRLAAELTQVTAAEQIGLRAKFVSEVERGNRGVRWHTLLGFLHVYGADLHALADAITHTDTD